MNKVYESCKRINLDICSHLCGKGYARALQNDSNKPPVNSRIQLFLNATSKINDIPLSITSQGL